MRDLTDSEKQRLRYLIKEFRRVAPVRKGFNDNRVVDWIEQEVLVEGREPSYETKKVLSTWCKTGTIYAKAQPVAQQISILLFGTILDRKAFGV
jgi:hypothetical protein